MQFTLSKKEVIESAGVCKSLSSKKSSMQVGNDIKLSIDGDVLKIVATDIESTFIGYYNVDNSVDGSILVNGSRFFDIISTFPEDLITVIIEKDLLIVNNESVNFSIPCRSTDLFFEFPEVIPESMIEIEGSIFKSMITSACVIGADSSDKRQHIIGVNVEFADGVFKMKSTDSNRLNISILKNEQCRSFSTDVFLVPKHSLSDLGKMLGKVSIISIGVAKGYFVTKIKNNLFLVRMLTGQFPNVDRLMQLDGKSTFVVEKNLFNDMLNRADVLFDRTYPAANFKFAGEEICVENLKSDLGIFKETFLVEEGPEDITPITVCLNLKYVYDAIKTVDEELVNIIVSDSKSAVFITDSQRNIINALMPMRE